MSPRSSRDPILGYRWWWAFRNSDGQASIRAWVWDIWWRVPGITEALHFDENQGRLLGGFDHIKPVPSQDCHCGLYSWFRLPKALTDIGRFTHFRGNKNGLHAVAGAVVTGGLTVIHGDEGMRTQFARPVAFGERESQQLGDDETLIRDLAGRFGVPVMPLDKLELYAREFGQTIAEDVSSSYTAS